MPSTAFPVGTAHVIGRTLTPEPERELPRDPVAFVRDELNEHLWGKQRQILRSVVEHRYTAVPSCHGSGKSYLAARCAAWWLAAHELGDAFVVTTAPTEAQVKAILWREIGKAQRRGNLPGRVTGDARWVMGPRDHEELVAFGRKPQDLSDPSDAMQAFQGIHARYVLVVVDEAAGIPAWLWDAVDSLVTNDASRVLAIGNPDNPHSHFAKVCSPGSGWNAIQIDAYDTPNLSGEPIPEYLRELLVSPQWVEERKARWGEDSPLYLSKVRGRFADTSEDSVITAQAVRDAQARDLPGTGRGAYGLDVARFGDDRSELYRDRDGVVRHVGSWRKQPTSATRLAVQAHLARTPEVPIGIDADGLGAGVYDEMRAELSRVQVVPFTAAGQIHDPRRFATRRSEIWWSYREAMEEGLIDLDPADDDLAAQLQQPRWSLDGRGRIRVETKDEMRKRGLPSPDRADAAMIAHFTALSPAVRLGRENAPTLQGPRRGSKMVTAGLRERRM